MTITGVKSKMSPRVALVHKCSHHHLPRDLHLLQLMDTDLKSLNCLFTADTKAAIMTVWAFSKMLRKIVGTD